MSILRTIVAVVVFCVTVYGIWKFEQWLTREPPKSQQVQAAESKKKYLRIITSDDAKTALQYKFVAHAALNMSDDTGFTIQEVHRLKLTLAAPSERSSKWTRDADAEKLLQDWMPFYGDTEGQSKAYAESDRVLSERRKDYNKYPCLSSVLTYVRLPKWGTSQSIDAMDKEMEPLFEDSTGMRFYGEKGSTNKCR